MQRWPRKNNPESIRARQDSIRETVGEAPLALSEEAWTRAQESHTGAVAIPVSVVGPLVVELGSYELEEPAGSLRETARAQEELLVPLAHTEGGLSASSVASASTVFPCPDWKNSNEGFLSPPMFASRIARSGFTGACCMT